MWSSVGFHNRLVWKNNLTFSLSHIAPIKRTVLWPHVDDIQAKNKNQMVFEIKQSTELKLITCLPLIISHHIKDLLMQCDCWGQTITLYGLLDLPLKLLSCWGNLRAVVVSLLRWLTHLGVFHPPHRNTWHVVLCRLNSHIFKLLSQQPLIKAKHIH